MGAVARADAVLEHIGRAADLIVPLANGEPVSLLDAIEAHADELDGVVVHQMHAIHDRPYLHGEFGDHLRHMSYFLSHVTRPCFSAGTVDLVPNNFSEMYDVLRRRTSPPPDSAPTSPPPPKMATSTEILAGVAVMALYIVTINRLFWHRLYALAARRYSMP